MLKVTTHSQRAKFILRHEIGSAGPVIKKFCNNCITNIWADSGILAYKKCTDGKVT